MTYIALITEVATGTVVAEPFDLDWDTESGEYAWSDGNFGCDCNRRIFFGNGGGHVDPVPEDEECGEGKFFVAIWDGNKLVYSDDW